MGVLSNNPKRIILQYVYGDPAQAQETANGIIEKLMEASVTAAATAKEPPPAGVVLGNLICPFTTGCNEICEFDTIVITDRVRVRSSESGLEWIWSYRRNVSSSAAEMLVALTSPRGSIIPVQVASSGAAFVAMMQSADFGNGNNPSEFGCLDRPRIGSVLLQPQVGPAPMIIT